MSGPRVIANSKQVPQMRKRQRVQRKAVRAKATGALLLLASLLLVIYAVPCFAASIWDEGLSSQHTGTVFSSPINDNAYQEDAAAIDQATDAAAATSVRAASKVNASVSETTGPGIALDDDAVAAAKKRVQAVSAAQAERDAVIGTITSEQPQKQDRTLETLTGVLALTVALLFGILGTRFIVRARHMRALIASLSYGNALKA